MTEVKERTMIVTAGGLCLNDDGSESIELPEADVKLGDIIMLASSRGNARPPSLGAPGEAFEPVEVVNVCHVFTRKSPDGKYEYSNKLVSCKAFK